MHGVEPKGPRDVSQMRAVLAFVAMVRSTLLVIDDEPNILTTVRRSLELEGYAVEVAANGASGLAKIADNDIDLVLLDVMMPGESGIEVLPKIRAASPETVVVMMSGNATIETAVQATKAGAHDFIEKPLSGDKLLLTVQNALSFARLRHENARLRGRARSDFAMIGKGAAMRAIFDKVAKTAPSTGRVLITGENGTGKELVARDIIIHRLLGERGMQHRCRRMGAAFLPQWRNVTR